MTEDPEDPFSRKYATNKDLFPKEREGKLDLTKLRNYGLAKQRIEEEDAFYFYQLVLPISLEDADK